MALVIANDSNLDELPNPLPVPGTDITIEFLPQPAWSLKPPQQDIIGLFVLSNADIEAYIRVQGDGPILGDECLLAYGKAEVILTSIRAPTDPFTYTDALSVLLGFRIKMEREGYRSLPARVLRTVSLDQIGFAAVYRPGVVRDVSA